MGSFDSSEVAAVASYSAVGAWPFPAAAFSAAAGRRRRPLSGCSPSAAAGLSGSFAAVVRTAAAGTAVAVGTVAGAFAAVTFVVAVVADIAVVDATALAASLLVGCTFLKLNQTSGKDEENLAFLAGLQRGEERGFD